MIDGMLMIYGTIAFISGCMLLWLYTKPGKKWLENL